jgi:hypothetical protein
MVRTNVRYGPVSFWASQILQSSQKIVKTFLSTVLWILFAFLSLKNDVNVPSKSTVISKAKKNIFNWRLEGQ